MPETKRPVRFQPSFIADDTVWTIRIPWPALGEQSAIANHIEHIKWFAKGFGGELNAEQTEWLFTFEHDEEYISAVRYLSTPLFNIKAVR